jgi:RimJ/RimL family protein N-acetyltransferase
MLREATEADVDTIRRWRNHPKVRRSSIYTAEITAEGHARWWASVQADPGRRVLVFERAGTPCGIVLINDHDPVARTAEWGFFLDVDGLEPRGELLPAWIELEREAIAYAFDDLRVDEVGGRTLAWNEPVLALHRRFGFSVDPARSYVTTIDGTDQDVVWTAMTREARSARA